MKIIKALLNKNIVFFFLICFIQNIYSQKDYRKGFVVTNKKDTISGYIDYRGGHRFKYCYFKSTKNGDFTKTYLPNQIKGYGFYNDSFYESKDIQIENDKFEKVFLEVLIRGKASLYKFKGTFYVKKGDTIFQKLDITQKKVIVNRKEYIRRSNRYLGVLRYILSDCSNLKEEIKKTLLTEKSITNLIEKYNTCTKETSISFKKDKKWLKAQFGLSIGINSSSLTLITDLPKGENNFSGNFGREISFIPGFFIEVSSPRINDYLSFFSEVSYLNTTFQVSDIYTSGASSERNNVSITLKQIKIPLGFRYTFPKRKITPFFTVGFSKTLTTSSNTFWTIEKVNNNIVEISEGLPFEINDSQLGFWASYGVNKKLLDNLNGFIEVRIESSNGTASFSNRPKTYKLPNIQFLIGITF